MSDTIAGVSDVPSTAGITDDDRARNPTARSGRRVSTGVVLSGLVFVVVLLAAVAPSVFAHTDPLAVDPPVRLRGPGTDHWFGTDNLGRDVFSRVVHAAGLSLSSTVIAVVSALVVGGIIGLVAATTGSALEALLMRGVDVLLSIPALILALALIAALGPGTTNVAVAVGVSLVANFARVMHGEALRIVQEPYVEAAVMSGLSRPAVVLRHVLPNAVGPVGALAVAEFGMAVLSISALSFLGFGSAPPTPEWGSLVAEGRNYLASAWWMSTLPGLTIAAVVLATYRLSRAASAGARR